MLAGAKLTLTHLGRGLAGQALVKHQIKAVDRLLGNPHLHRERQGIYRRMAASLLLGNERPVILIDSSDFELGRKRTVNVDKTLDGVIKIERRRQGD